MATTRISLRRSRKSARSKTSGSLSSEPSPDSKCPICLDVFNNMSYLDLCLHKFCFRCIHEWSKNKAECPLCKQPFNSIYHSIKSEKDFKKYDLRAAENGSFGSFGGARFRYRTTLTGVRRQQAQRRTSPPPDNGVMFESLSVAHPLQHQERTLRHMMARLAARRRAASEGREVRQLREQEMVTFRRELYRHGVRVRSVRDGGRSRDTSAEFYQRNPACLHRLIPWLKRELMVLYGAHGSLVNIVQHIIMSRITRHDMEDGAIQEELRPFLQGRTEHFLHEFISFAKSPFNMEAYDQHATYDLPAPSSNEDTSSNSSVIAISEDEHDSTVELDPPGDPIYTSGGALSESAWDDETPGPSYSTMVCLDSSRSQPLSVLDSDSDSSTEEEGGHGETMQECRAPSKQESPHHPVYSSPLGKGLKNGGLSSDDDDSDCFIVGFVKPVRERTPELVQLSSNSSEEVSPSHQTTEEVPMLPQHIRFVSVSPPASQSGEQHSRRSESTEQEHNQIGSRQRCSNPAVIRHMLSSRPSERRSSRPSERRSRDRHNRNSRGTRYSRSRERQRTRSRDRRRRSKSRDWSRSRGRRHSSSKSRDRCSLSQRDSRDRKIDGDLNHNCGTPNTERRSYYSKCHSRSSNRRSYSRSRSRSQGQESYSRDKHSRHPRSGSQSPSAKRKSRHDKPGGKRKYKTRHLEEPTKELHTEPDSSTASCTKEKKSKSRHHRKKSKEKSRKKSRSLSVEIVYDGSSSEKPMRHHKKKKKHKKKSKRHKSKERTGKHSSTVITIDSDSDHPANDCSVPQASSDNKDNRLNPADSTVLESMTGEMERQALTVGVNTVSKQESSQAVGASGELFKQSCVPHVEAETVEN